MLHIWRYLVVLSRYIIIAFIVTNVCTSWPQVESIVNLLIKKIPSSAALRYMSRSQTLAVRSKETVATVSEV